MEYSINWAELGAFMFLSLLEGISMMAGAVLFTAIFVAIGLRLYRKREGKE